MGRFVLELKRPLLRVLLSQKTAVYSKGVKTKYFYCEIIAKAPTSMINSRVINNGSVATRRNAISSHLHGAPSVIKQLIVHWHKRQTVVGKFNFRVGLWDWGSNMSMPNRISPFFDIEYHNILQLTAGHIFIIHGTK